MTDRPSHPSDEANAQPRPGGNPRRPAHPAAGPSGQEDVKVVNFLRQHRPSPPPAAPGLERSLLLEIEANQLRATRRHRQLWLGSLGAITIGCWALFQQGPGTQAPAPSVAEADLESFINETWGMTLAPSNVTTQTASTDDSLPWSFDPRTWETEPTKLVNRSLSAMALPDQWTPYL
ncbi:MAG: hypothetical protein BJG00_006940 [Limnothrix sp. CACIAM 69d]|nr:MAG: hypothetical protein BJG00_006940 [Limnothrix sp. CACIAM 69d]